MKNRTRIVLVIVYIIINFIYKILYHISFGGDSGIYVSLAKQYITGNFWDPSTNCTGHSLYAIFLMLFTSAFGYNHYIISFFQVIIFSVSSLLLINELEKYTNKNLIGLAILLFLVPEIHHANIVVLTESLGISMIILAFYMALKILNDNSTLLRMVLLSFFIACSILNRSESIAILIPVIYIIYPRVNKNLIKNGALLFSISFLFLMLNGWKNYKIYNVYKLTSFQAGEVIYGGNSKNLDGSHHPFWKYKEIFFTKEQLPKVDKILSQPECISCPQRDSFLTQLSKEAWIENPIQQVKIIPQKLAKNWLLPSNFDIYTSDLTKTQGLQINVLLSKEQWNNNWSAPYKHLFYMIIYWMYLILIIIGIFNRNKQNRFQNSVLIMLAFYLLYSIPFCGLPRWHATIFPLLVLAFMPSLLVNRVNIIIQRLFPRL